MKFKSYNHDDIKAGEAVKIRGSIWVTHWARKKGPKPITDILHYPWINRGA